MRSRALVLLLPALCLAGFSSLKILPGVREAGMGNTGVASGEGPQAMVWNPASSVLTQAFQLRVSYAKWLLDTHHSSLFLVRNLGFMRLGVGAVAFSAGQFEHRDEVPFEEPLGYFTPVDMTAHLNLARSFGDVVSLGITGRYYYSKILEHQATSIGLDAGIRVVPLEGLVLGVSVADLSRNPSYYRETFRLPFRARAGACYELCLGGEFGLQFAGEGSYFILSERFTAQGGIELDWSETVFLRTGYEWLDTRARFGLGLGLALGRFSFDYALTPLNDNLGLAHRVSVGLGR